MANIDIQESSVKYWGAIASLKMCQLAAEYNREHDEVDIAWLPEAIGFAIDAMDELGVELFPRLQAEALERDKRRTQ